MGTTSQTSRTKTCIYSALGLMPFAVGRIFVLQSFDENSKNNVRFFTSK